MITITKAHIDGALPAVVKGLEQYRWLQDRLHAVDVSVDRDFQRSFNHFYRVRRNEDWQAKFYRLFEDCKGKTVSFGEVLRALKEQTGQLEASFASKLVATLQPDKPIIDDFVLTNAELKLPYQYEKDREIKIVDVYESLRLILTQFMQSAEGAYLISQFKQRYPDAGITEMKMVDLVLWQTRS